jgi:NAD(P)-dependent dehydrogenase (short-subunit alcohol dehydrogenase family)
VTEGTAAAKRWHASAEVGAIDILVNNAGMQGARPREFPEAQWHELMQTN